ncbi:MAG: hypothetical protein HY791_23185 [Deltaproteobacteria bacterium]|nr:hypothetical protein [Deltaproteobacteria bacterium]
MSGPDKCSYCGQRKGKRPCPALGRVCSACCGEHRGVAIDCPSECAFLPNFSDQLPTSFGEDWFAVLNSEFAVAHLRGSNSLEEAANEFLRGVKAAGRHELVAFALFVLSLGRGSDGTTLGEHAAGRPSSDPEHRRCSALRSLRFALLRIDQLDDLRHTLTCLDLVSDRRQVFSVRTRLGDVKGSMVAAWISEATVDSESSASASGTEPDLPTEKIICGTLISGSLQKRTMLRAYRRALERLKRGDPSGERRVREIRAAAPAFSALREEAAIAFMGHRLNSDKGRAFPWNNEPKSATDNTPRELAVAEHALPPPAHEVMKAWIPGLANALAYSVKHLRSKPGWSEDITQSGEELMDIPGVSGLLELYFMSQQTMAFHPQASVGSVEFFSHHVHYMLNFELHLKKLFWVDESLAFMLRRTDLDIQGKFLKLPFAACAFVYTDRDTLDLTEAMLTRDETCGISGETVRILTAYVVSGPRSAGGQSLAISFVADSMEGAWPYLVARELFVRPEDDLESILTSHFPEPGESPRDPFFQGTELKALVHLVVNSILFATSADAGERRLRPPPASFRPRSNPGRAVSNEEVFWLPGKIQISKLKEIESSERTGSGPTLVHRSIVRGHWRRANPSWHDQRVRWIEPYWKGPDMATIIERDYKLTP